MNPAFAKILQWEGHSKVNRGGPTGRNSSRTGAGWGNRPYFASSTNHEYWSLVSAACYRCESITRGKVIEVGRASQQSRSRSSWLDLWSHP